MSMVMRGDGVSGYYSYIAQLSKNQGMQKNYKYIDSFHAEFFWYRSSSDRRYLFLIEGREGWKFIIGIKLSLILLIYISEFIIEIYTYIFEWSECTGSMSLQRNKGMVEDQPQMVIKVVFVGDSGVGKTSLINREHDDTFVKEHLATIGVDFRIKTYDLGLLRVKGQLWDTAGQERFRSIQKPYYKSINAFYIQMPKQYACVSPSAIANRSWIWTSGLMSWSALMCLVIICSWLGARVTWKWRWQLIKFWSMRGRRESNTCKLLQG